MPANTVIACTAALFFSGYAIQQRTLRDLRAAIRQPARPSPKIFLPDRFQKSTTELEDGTIVVLLDDDDDGKRHGDDPVVVEVKSTVSEGDDHETEAAPRPVEEEEDRRILYDPKPQPWKAQKPVPFDKMPNPDGKPEKPISRAERRRRIKEEIKRLSMGESPIYYQRRLW